MERRSGSAGVVIALVGLAGSGACGGLQYDSQDREIHLAADYANVIGYHEEPRYDSAAPGLGDWSDSGSIFTGDQAFPYSGASGSQASTMTGTHVHGTGAVSGYATTTLVTDSRSASALSRVMIRFTVSSPTPIVFDGSIDSATYDLWRGPYQPVQMRFKNVTTGQVLGEVQSGWLNGPLWEIGDPVHLEMTLQPGLYEIFGEANQYGAGERPPHYGWSGVGSFTFNLDVVPAPGAAVVGVGVLGLSLGVSRRR